MGFLSDEVVVQRHLESAIAREIERVMTEEAVIDPHTRLAIISCALITHYVGALMAMGLSRDEITAMMIDDIPDAMTQVRAGVLDHLDIKFKQ